MKFKIIGEYQRHFVRGWRRVEFSEKFEKFVDESFVIFCRFCMFFFSVFLLIFDCV